MKKLAIGIAALLIMSGVGQLAYADPLTIKQGDTIQKQLEMQKGKKVTVRLQSGEELTGTVRTVTTELIHLGELSGKEFFDALIDVSRVNAIIVRVK